MRQDDGRQQRADAGRGAQQAEPPRPDVEHVAGEHRQQRIDAAENDREQIERDGAEHRPGCAGCSEKPANSTARLSGSRDAAVRCTRTRLISTLAGDVERAAQRVDQDRAHRVEQPAERRPADHRDLRRRGAGRGGARQHRQRHDPRQQRGQRRLLEGARRADHEHHREQRFARHPAAGGAERERRRRQPGHELAGAHDHAPVVAVGDVAGDQHEQRRRNELRQADEPEIERVARQVVHLPAHRHRLHLQGDGAGNARDIQ